MSKRVFISVSFSHRHDLAEVLERIKTVVRDAGMVPQLFVETYHFPTEEAREMMAVAFRELGEVDLIVAEVTYKAFGVGIELGYGVALKKPIIGVHQQEAKLSSTVAGVADWVIGYDSVEELGEKLAAILEGLN